MSTFKPTGERKFLTTFRHTVERMTQVEVSATANVVLQDGIPKVEVVDKNPSSPTYGMKLLYSLQDAVAAGYAKEV